MRRLSLLVVAMVGMLTVYGQKPKNSKIETFIKLDKIAEAKEMADLAIEDEKLKSDPKTYYLRALVYVIIDTSSTYNYLADNAMEVAIESFDMAEMGTSADEPYFTDADGNLTVMSQHKNLYWAYYFNKGANAYGSEEFNEAVKYFERSQLISPEDTNAYINAGLAAHNAEDYETAKKNYYKSLDMGVIQKDIFNLLAFILGTIDNDLEEGLRVVQLARKAYPNDNDFARAEINFMIKAKKIEEAKINLEKAIEVEPNDPNLRFSLAILYEELATSEEDEAIKAKHTAGAMEAYQSAIKVDPNYYNAYFNIGVIQITQAEAVIKEYNNLGVSRDDLKRADALEPIIQEKLKIALPTWEKAVELKDDDIPSLETLKYIYMQLKMYDKAEAITKRIEELGGDD